MPASSEDLNALAEKLLALELEKEAEGEVIQDTLRLLEGSLEINDLQTLLKALDAIGTLCRDKNNRELVGKQPGLIAAIGSIFTKDLEATEENGKLIALAARAFGNLAFDNEENVDQIIPVFPPELVVSLLTRFNFSDALCNIASTIGNIVTVSEDNSYQVRLVQAGALPLVINLLKHESFEVQTKAVRAINNLAEGDANKAVLVQIGILKDLQNIVLNHNTPKGLRVEATEVLTSLFEKNPVALQQIIEDREVDRLLDIGLQSGNEGDGTSVDTHAFDLLVLYVGSEDKLRALFDASKVDSLLRRLDGPNRALASQVIRLLGHLALNDSIMPRIGLGHQHYVNALKSENGIDQLYGAMAIGNSARTEDICKQYMQDGAVPLLIGVCLDKDTEERARHLSASALRNIGITVEHRPLITQHEHCFEALIQILETNNAVVLFASVLAIKVLVTANPQGAEAFFATPEAVEKLVQMFERYMDEGQRRVQFETARIFPVLASYKNEYRTILAQKGGAAALQSLVTSTFAILQIEGLKELLIWAEDNDLQRLIQKEEGLVEGIIKSMGSGSSDVRELAAKLVHKLFGDHGLSLGELLDNHATLVLAIDKNL